jgi:hypothetical protein
MLYYKHQRQTQLFLSQYECWFDKAKTGAIRRQKAIGSLWDSQLPCYHSYMCAMEIMLVSFLFYKAEYIFGNVACDLSLMKLMNEGH